MYKKSRTTVKSILKLVHSCQMYPKSQVLVKSTAGLGDDMESSAKDIL